MRVLIVEDDQHIRDLITQVVDSFGYKAYPVSSIEEATTTLNSVRPHIVLLDLLMNGDVSTGFIDIIKQLTGDEVPEIIVLSAMTGAKHIADAHKVEFLSKPFDIDQLHDALQGKIKRPQEVNPEALKFERKREKPLG